MNLGKRIEDYGYKIGTMEKGKLNKITDVEGVLVGHETIADGKNNTGVTVILPSNENTFLKRPVAASYVLNGYGKTQGLVQIDELGELETPIALTNTLNVGIVHDAVVEYTLKMSENAKERVTSINAVVGETNDSRINFIENRAVKKEHVMRAFENAKKDFKEGDVGAGKGTVCYGFKGGIGSASRVFELGGKKYTIGAIVQSNFGFTGDIKVGNEFFGDKAILWQEENSCEDKGSIMVVVATDLPVTARQLKRILKRGAVGLARTGSYIGHGSGDIFIGFSTAQFRDIENKEDIRTLSYIDEDEMNKPFRGAVESIEEAVLNSLVAADTVTGYDGKTYYSFAKFLEENK